MYEMVFAVRDEMPVAYPELKESAERVSKVVLAEEEQFARVHAQLEMEKLDGASEINDKKLESFRELDQKTKPSVVKTLASSDEGVVSLWK